MAKKSSDIMKTQEYIEEIATCPQLKIRKMQPCHRRVQAVETIQGLVYLFLWGTAKIMTVPILTNVCCLIDCPLQDDGRRHLSIASEVICFEGRHLYIVSTVLLLVTAYILIVIPFALVGSNAAVWSSTPSLRELPRLAALYAGQVNIAFLTPFGFNWCICQLAELIVKACLPLAAVLQNQHHFFRCSLITAVCLGDTLVAAARPAYAHPVCSGIFVSKKLAIAYISACTMYGGYWADKAEAAPHLVEGIVGGLVIILVITLIRIVCFDMQKDETSASSDENNKQDNVVSNATP